MYDVVNGILTITILFLSFVDDMKNTIIRTEGDDATIHCKAAGNPKPRITWLKDGQDLVITDRLFFAAKDQVLVIVGVQLSDAGR